MKNFFFLLTLERELNIIHLDSLIIEKKIPFVYSFDVYKHEYVVLTLDGNIFRSWKDGVDGNQAFIFRFYLAGHVTLSDEYYSHFPKISKEILVSFCVLNDSVSFCNIERKNAFILKDRNSPADLIYQSPGLIVWYDQNFKQQWIFLSLLNSSNISLSNLTNLSTTYFEDLVSKQVYVDFLFSNFDTIDQYHSILNSCCDAITWLQFCHFFTEERINSLFNPNCITIDLIQLFRKFLDFSPSYLIFSPINMKPEITLFKSPSPKQLSFLTTTFLDTFTQVPPDKRFEILSPFIRFRFMCLGESYDIYSTFFHFELYTQDLKLTDVLLHELIISSCIRGSPLTPRIFRLVLEIYPIIHKHPDPIKTHIEKKIKVFCSSILNYLDQNDFNDIFDKYLMILFQN